MNRSGSRALTLPSQDESAKSGDARAFLERILSETINLYQDALDHARSQAPEWYENLAFYLGFQHGYITPIGYYEPSTADEACETINYVQPTVKTAVSATIRGLPNPETVPSNDSMSTIAKAEVAQGLVRGFLRSDTFPSIINIRARTGAEVFGGVWLKTWWDPFRGRRVSTTDEETGEESRAFEGEVITRPYPPDQALADPIAKDEDSIRYICHRKTVPISTLEQQFPEDIFGESTVGKFQVGEAAFALGLRSSADMMEHGLFGSARQGGGAAANGVAELVELWWKPDQVWEDGLLVVFSGQTLIYAGGFPDEIWPWDLRYGDTIDPFGLYPLGLVSPIKPMQRTLNRSATKRREILDRKISPGLLIPRGGDIDPDLIDDIIGWRVHYTPPHKPEWMQVGEIPGSLFELEDASIAVIQTVSTYSDISRGQPVQGLETGRAIAYTLEAQHGTHEPTVKTDNDVIASVLTKELRIAGRRYQEGRMVRAVGENKRPYVRSLKMGDVDWAADVVIEPYSGKPNSRALRFAEAMEVFQAGGFADEPAAKAFREVVDMDTEDSSTTQWRQAHVRRARAEQLDIMGDAWAPIVVFQRDDHDLHLREHVRWSVTDEFLALDPVAQELFLEHIAEHEMYRAPQLDAFAQEQQMLTGGGGAGPDGGAPPEKAPGIESPMDGGHSTYTGDDPAAPTLEPENLSDETGAKMPSR